jgi:hypothetical protein
MLRFIASVSASTFHAVDAIARGRSLSDPRVAEALWSPLEAIRVAVAARDLSLPELLTHLVPLAAGIEDNRQLAEVACRKAFGPPRDERLETELALAFAQAEMAFRHALPALLDELEQHGHALRDRWEADGPGLLHSLERLTEPGVLPDQAVCVLVWPATGGGGVANPAYNSLRIEVLPADPVPEFPEVLRLAWLLAQLNIDLPRFQGNLTRQRAARAAALALVPLTLAAAAEEALSHDDAATLARALETWDLVPAGQRIPHAAQLPAATSGTSPDAAALPSILSRWWETYAASRPGWHVALAALDRMLEGA